MTEDELTQKEKTILLLGRLLAGGAIGAICIKILFL